MTDRQLLSRTRSGDAEAFGEFFRLRHGAVLGFLRVRVPDAEIAADLMCETFANALVAVHDHGRELPVVPIAWLLTIARNLLVDSVRRGQIEDAVRRRLAMEPLQLDDSDLRAVEQAAADADILDELAGALSDDELEAFTKRVFEERDFRDLAEDLKVSDAVVRKRVSRARARLRALRLEGQRATGA